MGKHTKKSNPLPRRSRESEWDASEDRLSFDFLTETGEDLPDLDTESILSEILAEETPAPEAAPQEIPSEAAPPEETPEEPAPEGESAEEVSESPAEERPAPKPKTSPAKKRPAGKKRRISAAEKARRAAIRSKKRFRRGLLVYVLALLALIVGTLVYEWHALGKAQERIDAEAAEEAARKAAIAQQQAYEKAVYRAPQLAFESWKDGTDAAFWTDLWFSVHPDSLDRREAVTDYMGSRFGAAEAFRAMEYTAEKPVYVLKDGAETLAKVTLTGGELNWTVTDVEMLLEGTESASIRVASGSTVMCNGVVLDKTYVSTSDSYFRYEPLRDKLVNPVSWDTYEVSGLLIEPELTAQAPTGGTITQTAEGDFLFCLDGDVSAYTNKAVNFVRDYLFYYMSGGSNTDGNLNKALSHLVPGTQAYQELRQTRDGVYWNTAYSQIDTTDTKAGDVVIWADNVYSVDVSYNAKGYNPFSGKVEDYASSVIRIYYKNDGNGFYISNFETL